MLSILPIPAFKDNYIWVILSNEIKKAIVVDPGEALPVKLWLEKNDYELAAILITHHHFDHTNGISALLSNYDVSVYGPENETINGKTDHVRNKSLIELSGFPPIQVIAIPGHTLGHVAYLIENHLFCGDTLFSAGCGRIFEGTPPQMYQSLQTLMTLPDDTLIYCGHEYTVANCRYAQVVEPNNQDIKDYLQQAISLRENERPTLPSSLALEKKVNPFLRCHLDDIKSNVAKHVNADLPDDLAVFARLREWKNQF